VLAAAYPAGTFLGALPGGWVAARIGVRRTTALGLSTLILSSLAFAFAHHIAAYGDALPYLALAALCSLTLVGLTRPRYSAALAGK
jgi:MFS family permease